jgi:hypothetical protein
MREEDTYRIERAAEQAAERLENSEEARTAAATADLELLSLVDEVRGGARALRKVLSPTTARAIAMQTIDALAMYWPDPIARELREDLVKKLAGEVHAIIRGAAGVR